MKVKKIFTTKSIVSLVLVLLLVHNLTLKAFASDYSKDTVNGQPLSNKIASTMETTIENFIADKASPQKVYTEINFSAKAQSNSGKALYRFSVSDGVEVKLLQDYSEVPTCQWLPTISGDYKIIVDVKDVNSMEDKENSSEIGFRIDGLKKIFIDPGHGGEDSGAVGYSGVLEKDVNLLIGNKVVAELRKYGMEVATSRTTDATVSLKERVALANNWKGDVFLSLHNNSYSSTSVGGTETYYYSGDSVGKEIAQKIQNNLIENLGFNNRGIKNGDELYVIKYTDMTSLLIEFGFLSNPEEEEKMNKNEYQEAATKSVVDGFLEYYNVKRDDLNKDGNIDIMDLSFMAKNYNINKSNGNWNLAMDINNDGVIDIYDIVSYSKIINQ